MAWPAWLRRTLMGIRIDSRDWQDMLDKLERIAIALEKQDALEARVKELEEGLVTARGRLKSSTDALADSVAAHTPQP